MSDPLPELSRQLVIGRIPARGQVVTITATQGECDALALRFGIPAVLSLEARVNVSTPDAAGMVHVMGEVWARVRQTCVVSLDPVDQTVRERIDRRYVAVDLPVGAPQAPHEAAIDLDPDDDDPPDPAPGGVIDLGEAAAEQVALGLDPYPRRADAEIPETLRPPGAVAAEAEPERRSPFAVLESLLPADHPPGGRGRGQA